MNKKILWKGCLRCHCTKNIFCAFIAMTVQIKMTEALNCRWIFRKKLSIMVTERVAKDIRKYLSNIVHTEGYIIYEENMGIL